MEDIQEVQELSLEKVIETKLVQANVTQQVLSALKDKYGSMTLKALDDKESYLELKAGKKECSKVRNLIVKICTEGRDDALKIQKAWIAKQKDLVGTTLEVEDPLDAEIKKFDDEVARKDAEEKERQEAAYINRQAVLSKMGATYVDGCFVLGAASFEANLVKGTPDEIWNETVMPKFKDEYEKIEVVRVAEERRKSEEAAELKRKQDELAAQQKAFEEQQAAFKKQQEEAARKVEEEKKKIRDRRDAELRGYIVFIRDYNAMLDMDEDTYQKEFADMKKGAELQWEYDEKERVRKQEEDKQQAIQDALRKQQEKQKEEAELAEIKRKQAEAAKAEELDKASDKRKWEEFTRQLSEVDTFDMRSGQYRKKMQMAKEKLAEILAL